MEQPARPSTWVSPRAVPKPLRSQNMPRKTAIRIGVPAKPKPQNKCPLCFFLGRDPFFWLICLTGWCFFRRCLLKTSPRPLASQTPDLQNPETPGGRFFPGRATPPPPPPPSTCPPPPPAPSFGPGGTPPAPAASSPRRWPRATSRQGGAGCRDPGEKKQNGERTNQMVGPSLCFMSKI